MASTEVITQQPFGLNDTPFNERRGVSECAVLQNFRPRKSGSIESIQGRKNIQTGYPGRITGIACPPQDLPLVTLTTLNNALRVSVQTSPLIYWVVYLATGDYYTYAELATALQTALNDQAATTWTVDYNVVANKFRVTTSGSEPRLWWDHDDTTLDKTLFGFNWPAYGAAGTCTSEFEVSQLTAYKRLLFCQDGKLYDTDKTEVTYPDGTSLEAGQDKWNVNWQSGKLAFCSNGALSGIIRDQYFRDHAKKENIFWGSTSSVASSPPLYNNLGVATLAKMAFDTNAIYAPVTLYTTLYGFDEIGSIQFRAVKLTGGTYSDQWTCEVYIEEPDYGIQTLIGTITPQDVGTTDPAITSITLNTTPAIYKYSANTRVLFKLVTEIVDLSDVSLHLYTSTGAGYGDCYKLNSTCQWVVQTGLKLEMRVSLGLSNNSYPTPTESTMPSGVHQYKASFENEEGFETELTDAVSITSVAGQRNVLYLKVPVYAETQRIDFKYINIYRTVADGDIFYLLVQLEKSIVEQRLSQYPTVASFYYFDSHPDTSILTSAEADDVTTRVSLDYKISAEVSGRIVVAIDDQYFRSSPEHWQSFDNIPLIGDNEKLLVGGDITGIGSFAGDAIIFKRNAVWLDHALDGAAGIYQLRQNDQYATGTKSPFGILTAQTPKGWACFFIGDDGHIYVTTGIEKVNISVDRLDVLVKTINLNALQNAFAIWNNEKQEALFAVPTGSNTYPDTVIIYNPDIDRFYLQKTPSDYYVDDKITDADGIQLVIGATNRSADIEGITLGSGVVVSIESTDHGFITGDQVCFDGVGGTNQLNGNAYTITRVDTDNYTLDGTDGDDFTAWTSGGTAYTGDVYTWDSAEQEGIGDPTNAGYLTDEFETLDRWTETDVDALLDCDGTKIVFTSATAPTTSKSATIEKTSVEVSKDFGFERDFDVDWATTQSGAVDWFRIYFEDEDEFIKFRIDKVATKTVVNCYKNSTPIVTLIGSYSCIGTGSSGKLKIIRQNGLISLFAYDDGDSAYHQIGAAIDASSDYSATTLHKVDISFEYTSITAGSFIAEVANFYHYAPDEIYRVIKVWDNDFGYFKTLKVFTLAEMSAYADAEGQTLNYSWFLDKSATAHDSQTLELDTDREDHLIYVDSSYNKYYAWQVVNTDANGKVYFAEHKVEIDTFTEPFR